jgi:hypothetical protein
MTSQQDIERTMADWLAEGPTEISDRMVESALDQIEHMRQRRVLRAPFWMKWRGTTPVRLAVGAAIVAAVVLGSTLAIGSLSPKVGPSPRSSQTPPVTTPTPLATSRVPGTTSIAPRAPLFPGTTYSTRTFSPTFTIEGGTNWVLTQEGPSHVLFNHPPNAALEPGGFTFSLVAASAVLPPISSRPTSSEALPADLIAWLQARSDLALASPTFVMVDGIPATAIEGTVRSGAETNSNGGINLICGTDSTCSQDPVAQPGASPTGQAWETEVSPGRPFRLIVLTFDGQTVVIGMNDAGNEWTTAVKLLDPFLAGLRFPATGN